MNHWIPYRFVHEPSSFSVLIAPGHVLRGALEQAFCRLKAAPLHITGNDSGMQPVIGMLSCGLERRRVRTGPEVREILDETGAPMVVIEHFPGMLDGDEGDMQRFTWACRAAAHERGVAVRVIATEPEKSLMRLAEEADRAFLSIQLPMQRRPKQREYIAVRDDRQRTLGCGW